MIGKKLGRYEILSKLGAGGMGEVYRARDLSLGRDIALKVLPERVREDPDRLRRFEQEARAASALNHPNIVTIYDIGQSDGVPYIAMEIVEGHGRQWLANTRGELVERVAIRLLCPLTEIVQPHGDNPHIVGAEARQRRGAPRDNDKRRVPSIRDR
jgi:serine/threonine protein kinase